MQMSGGPWFRLNFLLSTPPDISGTAYEQIQQSFRDMVDSMSNAEGLPLFINDASLDQNPLQNFSTYSHLQSIKRRYDPQQVYRWLGIPLKLWLGPCYTHKTEVWMAMVPSDVLNDMCRRR